MSLYCLSGKEYLIAYIMLKLFPPKFEPSLEWYKSSFHNANTCYTFVSNRCTITMSLGDA